MIGGRKGDDPLLDITVPHARSAKQRVISAIRIRECDPISQNDLQNPSVVLLSQPSKISPPLNELPLFAAAVSERRSDRESPRSPSLPTQN